jgi:hypothetical protein
VLSFFSFSSSLFVRTLVTTDVLTFRVRWPCRRCVVAPGTGPPNVRNIIKVSLFHVKHNVLRGEQCKVLHKHRFFPLSML